MIKKVCDFLAGIPATIIAGVFLLMDLVPHLTGTGSLHSLPFDPAWDFDFLSETEAADCACGASYRQMLRQWKREYVYEMMRLGLEVTPYRTLEHIAGVHHIALTCGRALRRSGTAVDLALVSGSAAGHDLGKFGCHPGERVAYLHYYYTDLWFRRHRLTDIGHVAANHSVWDLEPEYLSAEALLLIYADFRVKQTHDPKGHEITHISSLAEAFDVILNKLDDVDGEKRRRYTRVYARLQDFEAYMIRRGVDVTMQGADTQPLPEQAVALMEDAEVLESLTMQCVAHNMELMNRLTGQRSFASLLEQARGETNWRRLRAYLGVFESYSLYLHIPQKVQTLAFLYELLMHREGDIRRQAAALMGEIIAGFHAGYAKERPADSRPDLRTVTDLDQWRLYLEKIIYPDHKLMPQHPVFLLRLRPAGGCGGGPAAGAVYPAPAECTAPCGGGTVRAGAPDGAGGGHAAAGSRPHLHAPAEAASENFAGDGLRQYVAGPAAGGYLRRGAAFAGGAGVGYFSG